MIRLFLRQLLQTVKQYMCYCLCVYTNKYDVVKNEFDSEYYLSTNPDIKNTGVDPYKHYMSYGWRQGRNPTRYFNSISYLLTNPDLFLAGVNPFFHYIIHGRNEGRSGIQAKDIMKQHNSQYIFSSVQDITFPRNIEHAQKLFIIVVPEHATMSGGIYSMFSIATASRRLKKEHSYEVVVMTRPNRHDMTYCRQHNFRNTVDVYRFEQITRCLAAEEVYINIPEYATVKFVDNLSPPVYEYLNTRKFLHINILNQNVELMPEPNKFKKLRALSNNLTQSVAHHAYFGQGFADKYNLPTLLLPAFTDLSEYEPSNYSDKEKLIIYSPDEAPHKKKCLQLIRDNFPQYGLLEIRDITFDEYMEYATKCMFSITFGEGFDGYLAQPIYQGGISFAVYNDDYFPSREFLRYDNIFRSNEQMITKICEMIAYYSQNREAYADLNSILVNEYNMLYSYEDYVNRIKKLITRSFDIYPAASNEDISI